MTFQTELGNGQKPINLEQGWAAIDGMAEHAAKLEARQFQQQLELASHYRQALATPAGRLMLEDLIRTFMMQRIVQPGDKEHAPGIRQGQSDVVRRLLAMVDFANTGGGRVTGTPNQE